MLTEYDSEVTVFAFQDPGILFTALSCLHFKLTAGALRVQSLDIVVPRVKEENGSRIEEILLAVI